MPSAPQRRDLYGMPIMTASNEPEIPQAPKSTVKGPKTGSTILVVDDDESMRLLVKTALESDGYAFLEAKNGREALQLFKRHTPDLVLMDAALPTMDGFEACAKINELPGGIDTPVIMVTSLNDDPSVEKAFAAGAVDFLTKPLHWAVTRHRVRRILAAARTEKELRQLAYHDPLTGLPNRLLLLDRAGIALSRSDRTGRLLAVMFVDMDGFKTINDSFGHEAGDSLLCTLADCISGSIRKNDTVSRVGGDEFLVLVEDLGSPQDIRRIAEKILTQIRRISDVAFAKRAMTASVGIALFPHDANDIGSLIKLADAAMYRAKQAGGNAYRFCGSAKGPGS